MLTGILLKKMGHPMEEFTDYLKKEDMRKYSPLIFDALSLIAYKNNSLYNSHYHYNIIGR